MCFLHLVVLQVHLHGVGVRDRIAQRRTGGKDHAPALILLLDAPHLVEHFQTFFRAGNIDAGNSLQIAPQGDILEVVGLVHKECIDFQLVKGDGFRAVLQRTNQTKNLLF